MQNSILLEVININKFYTEKNNFLFKKNKQKQILNNINFKVEQGDLLGIVGESGCGKTTLANIISGLVSPDAGSIIFQGQNIFKIQKSQLRTLRKNFQIIFQDPYSALNPKRKIYASLAEPFLIHKTHCTNGIKKSIEELIDLVGISKNSLDKYPHEFSGGQRQRIVIARAIALRPKLIIADEPVSSLDVSIQAQILKLFIDLQKELNLTYILISHDLAVIKTMCTKVVVIKKGNIVEQGNCNTIYASPQHEYTKKLLNSIPVPVYPPRRKFIL